MKTIKILLSLNQQENNIDTMTVNIFFKNLLGIYTKIYESNI